MCPTLKNSVLRMKSHYFGKQNRITQEELRDYDCEILEIFYDLHRNLKTPLTQRMQNTDGHAFIPHKLTFDVISANGAFEALHPLCLDHDREELLKEAKIKEDKILHLEFAWLKKGNKQHKDWDNTVLGHITLDENKMIFEVNSKERAEAFQKVLKKQMPTGWTLRSTVIESIEEQLRNRPQISSEKLAKQEAFQNSPEYKNLMETMMKKHWETWYDQKIPALNHMTPKQAKKTPQGRELLEALLKNYEYNAAANPMIGQTMKTIKEVRKNLDME